MPQQKKCLLRKSIHMRPWPSRRGRERCLPHLIFRAPVLAYFVSPQFSLFAYPSGIISRSQSAVPRTQLTKLPLRKFCAQERTERGYARKVNPLRMHDIFSTCSQCIPPVLRNSHPYNCFHSPKSGGESILSKRHSASMPFLQRVSSGSDLRSQLAQ